MYYDKPYVNTASLLRFSWVFLGGVGGEEISSLILINVTMQKFIPRIS